MTAEDKWTKSICSLLKDVDFGENIYIDVLQKIPYALEVSHFDENWEIESNGCKTNSFQTDLVIYEKSNGKIKPRVIIESKYEKVTTHDAITYSNKAIYHKNVVPYVRYGIMLGNREHYPLPGRLFRHGTHFDFLFSFIGDIPTEKEKYYFVEMIRKEIEYSKKFEEIISNSRSKGRRHYFMCQKEFNLEEM